MTPTLPPYSVAASEIRPHRAELPCPRHQGRSYQRRRSPAATVRGAGCFRSVRLRSLRADVAKPPGRRTTHRLAGVRRSASRARRSARSRSSRKALARSIPARWDQDRQSTGGILATHAPRRSKQRWTVRLTLAASGFRKASANLASPSTPCAPGSIVIWTRDDADEGHRSENAFWAAHRWLYGRLQKCEKKRIRVSFVG